MLICLMKLLSLGKINYFFIEMRKSDYKINKFILNRWSSRAMNGEKISNEELMTLFEAARWAPSSLNNQHWRFIYAERGSKYWDGFFNLLFEGNQKWCNA